MEKESLEAGKIVDEVVKPTQTEKQYDEIVEELQKMEAEKKHREAIERLSKVDELKPSKESKLSKIIAWLKIKKNIALVVISVMLVSCFIWIAKAEIKYPELKQMANESIEKVKIIKVTPENKDIFSIDLSKTEVTKHVLTTSIKSGKEIFGVWYKLETPKADIRNSVYLTIFENVDKLDINADEFAKYVKTETENAEKLSK